MVLEEGGMAALSGLINATDSGQCVCFVSHCILPCPFALSKQCLQAQLFALGGSLTFLILSPSLLTERLRLRALVVCRRMLYEVGSTSRMDEDAIRVG